MTTNPTSKADLLTAISNGYNAFEKFLSPLTQEQLLTPGVNGTWSTKDNIAHIVSWQQHTLDFLNAAAQKRTPAQLSEAATDEDVDQINERFYQENKDRSLNEVLQTFRTSYVQLISAVQALSAEELFDPARFTWMEGTPLWHKVSGNTYEHYQEHTGIIAAWLNASGSVEKRK